MSLNISSLRLFAACSYKPTAEGLPPSLAQHPFLFQEVFMPQAPKSSQALTVAGRSPSRDPMLTTALAKSHRPEIASRLLTHKIGAKIASRKTRRTYMRKISAVAHLSLDGVMQGQGSAEEDPSD